MRMVWAAILAAIAAAWIPFAARGQSATTDPIVVSSEHPRLFLRPARLRLLRRERERTSLRWEQFHSLMAGNAAMPASAVSASVFQTWPSLSVARPCSNAKRQQHAADGQQPRHHGGAPVTGRVMGRSNPPVAEASEFSSNLQRMRK